MQTIRRLYLYLLSGISLAVLAVGLVGLLSLLFSQLGTGLGNSVVAGGGPVAERLSLAVALTGVALPVWLVHWWLLERGVAGRDAAAHLERAVDIRALYLSAVLLMTLIIGAFSAVDLIRNLLDVLFEGSNDQTFGLSPPSDSLAWLVVMAGVWGYHVSVRLRDMRVAPLMGPAAALPRLYLYIAAVIGLLMLLLGVHDLVGVLVLTISSAPGLTGAGPAPSQVVGGVAAVIVGAVVWGGHWLYATRIAARDDWRGQSERESRLRTAYLVVVTVGAAAWAVGLVAGGLGELLRTALGLAPPGGPDIGQIAQSLLAAIPFAVTAWLHHGWLRAEGLAFGGAPQRLTAERLAGYLLAAVGLLVTASGAAWLLGILIDMALGGARTVSGGGDVWRREVSQAVALVISGAPLWLWFWYRAQGRRTRRASAADEAASAMRRVYLFAALGGSLIALIVSIAILLYRGLNVALQSSASGSTASDVSGALGGFVVAAGVIAYHAVLLRRDVTLRRTTDAREAAEAAEVAEAASVAGDPAASASVSVVITGPPGVDADNVVAGVTAGLPAGYAIRRADPETPA